MYFGIIVQLSIVFIIQSAAAQTDGQSCGCCTSGIPGIPGTHGTAGAPGLTGDGGLKGEKGYPGKAGPIGIQGVPGEAGQGTLKGNAGLKGEKGEQGFNDSPGEKGATASSQHKSAFSVAFKNDPGRLPIGPMKYDTTFTNIGSDYSMQTGKFVCQYPGTYVFHFTSQHGSGQGSFSTTIKKNGLRTVSGWATSSTATSASNMVILDLVAGDEVWTEPVSTSYNYYSSSNGHCSFSGFLLYTA